MDPDTPALRALDGSDLAYEVVRTERARSAEESAAFQGIELGQLLRTIVVRRAEGDYVAQDAHGIPSRIRIAPRIERYGNLYLLDVLLHEMVHAWQHEVLDDLENGYRGHGPRFCQKANEIGRKLGLGPVAPKGRGGLPRPDSWPSNVRPPEKCDRLSTY